MAINQAMFNVAPLSPEVLAAVERVATGPEADAQTYLWAARMYAWAANKPINAKVEWTPDMAASKERCRDLLKLAVESGLSAAFWKNDSVIQSLFNAPGEDIAMNWLKPTKPVKPNQYWMTFNPLKEFAG